jgi:hypothetical protein
VPKAVYMQLLLSAFQRWLISRIPEIVTVVSLSTNAEMQTTKVAYIQLLAPKFVIVPLLILLNTYLAVHQFLQMFQYNRGSISNKILTCSCPVIDDNRENEQFPECAKII